MRKNPFMYYFFFFFSKIVKNYKNIFRFKLKIKIFVFALSPVFHLLTQIVVDLWNPNNKNRSGGTYLGPLEKILLEFCGCRLFCGLTSMGILTFEIMYDDLKLPYLSAFITKCIALHVNYLPILIQKCYPR